jgi:hypothetical protein
MEATGSLQISSTYLPNYTLNTDEDTFTVFSIPYKEVHDSTSENYFETRKSILLCCLWIEQLYLFQCTQCLDVPVVVRGVHR